MVRRYTPEVKNRVFRISYWIGVLVIIIVWIWAFREYFARYEYLHPEITWAIPGIDNQLIKVKGILLWKENVITAPASGMVTYPLGKGPVRVARGAVIARVGSQAVKAYQQGYFVAGKDGQESQWRYSILWPADAKKWPAKTELRYFQDNNQMGRGQIIGKLIELPQELRFIGYMPKKGNIEKQVAGKKLQVRFDDEDTPSRAEIRVTQDLDDRIKLYLTMSWFPPGLVTSRNYELIIDAGQTEGALVPRSAILDKNGIQGIYLVRGARVIFVPVEGRNMPNNKFLVTRGISIGDAIVETASSTREGRIQLW